MAGLSWWLMLLTSTRSLTSLKLLLSSHLLFYV